MTLLNKVVEMEYIITINVNITYIDANQNSETNSFTTGSFQVQQDDQKTIKMLSDHVVYHCIPPGYELIRYHLIYYDQLPGFAILGDADMNMSVQQFMQSRTPSSRDLNRTDFTFSVNIVAEPIVLISARRAPATA